jgi:alpha-beta hydrolase superfamily lysophospholipase
MRFWAILFLHMLVAACAPLTQKTGIYSAQPALEGGHFVTADGVRLPLSVHRADAPKAIIVALHGFNDYRSEFDPAAEWWRQRGITTYAYDQRGFGGAPRRGIWPEPGVLAADAKSFIALIREAHPNQKVFLLGMSMGAPSHLNLQGPPRPLI